jgi:hypothetical protein
MSNYNNSLIIESYDARYANITVDDCAKFCKTTAGCFGFGYDAQNKTCYPSDNELSGKPVKSLYEKEYNDDNVLCNKMETIIEPSDTLSVSERKTNAMFFCGEKRSLHPQLYFHNMNKLNLIKEGQNPDFIKEVDEYNVLRYKWPSNEYDVDQLDLIRENRDKQIFSINTVTNMDRIRNAKPDPPIQPVHTIVEQDKTVMDKVIDGLNDLQKVISVSLVPQGIDQNYNRVETFDNDPKLYKMYDRYNQGIYLKNHKCVNNVGLKNCLDYCSNNKDCVGTEHNPKFFNNLNVCCPYKSIEKLVDRCDKYKMYKHGKLYAKVNDDTNNESTHIII